MQDGVDPTTDLAHRGSKENENRGDQGGEEAGGDSDPMWLLSLLLSGHKAPSSELLPPCSSCDPEESCSS